MLHKGCPAGLDHERDFVIYRRSAKSLAPPGTPNRLTAVPDVDSEFLDLDHLTYTQRDMLADLDRIKRFAYL